MLFKQLIGLTISALLTIGNNGFVSPAITWLNNSSLNITIGSSVNYYFDLEFNEWYPASGSVDTGGTGRCDTNIIIGNGTDPMTGFIQYERTSITRGTNLISYDENVAITSNMIYFYNVSSFTLTTFTSTDTGDLNQPTFTVNFTDGLIWSEQDSTDTYNLINSMQSNISSIAAYEEDIYGQVLQMAIDLGATADNIEAITQNIVSIDSKMDNILSYLSTINGHVSNLYYLYNELRNHQVPLYSLPAYYMFRYANSFYTHDNANFVRVLENSQYPALKIPPLTFAFTGFHVDNEDEIYFLFLTSDIYSDINFKSYGDNNTVTRKSVKGLNGQIYFCSIVLDTSNLHQKWIYPSIPTTKLYLVPVYIGGINGMPDDIAQIFQINKYDDTTNELNQANDDLENAYSQEDALIQTVTSDLDNNVPTVTTQDSVLGSESFFNAANWVKNQFDRITITEAPILGNLLSFSLIIGLAIAFIGRRLGN